MGFYIISPVEVYLSLAVLDLLLAQSTPPAALWACRLRLFTPRGIARSAAPLVGETECKDCAKPNIWQMNFDNQKRIRSNPRNK